MGIRLSIAGDSECVCNIFAIVWLLIIWTLLVDLGCLPQGVVLCSLMFANLAEMHLSTIC